MNTLPGTLRYPVIKISGKEAVKTNEPIIEETPLTIFLNGQELITMLASAGEEEFLAVGFLASEGIIKETADIKKMDVNQLSGIIKIETVTGETVAEKIFLKRYLTACCGKGRSSFNFANDAFLAKTVTSKLTLTPEVIINYVQMLETQSELFQATGAVHGGAIAEGGKVIFFSFDIGRHNVFDKIYGRCLIENIPTENKIMVFTGRISSEILLKLSKMNIPVVIARSAPTSLALDMAEELGITVIGFARGERLNIYTHSYRVEITE